MRTSASSTRAQQPRLAQHVVRGRRQRRARRAAQHQLAAAAADQVGDVRVPSPTGSASSGAAARARARRGTPRAGAGSAAAGARARPPPRGCRRSRSRERDTVTASLEGRNLGLPVPSSGVSPCPSDCSLIIDAFSTAARAACRRGRAASPRQSHDLRGAARAARPRRRATRRWTRSAPSASTHVRAARLLAELRAGPEREDEAALRRRRSRRLPGRARGTRSTGCRRRRGARDRGHS